MQEKIKTINASTHIGGEPSPSSVTPESALIENWIAANGHPRRFEQGVSSSPEYYRSYLQRFGIRLRTRHVRSSLRKPVVRCHVSQDGGNRWHFISRSALRDLVDQLRTAEGREPLKAARP